MATRCESLERRVLCSRSVGAPAGGDVLAGPDLQIQSFQVANLKGPVYGGRIGTAEILLANTGNTIALGDVKFQIVASRSDSKADVAAGTMLTHFDRVLHLKPGATRMLRVRFAVQADPPAGSYVIVASANPDQSFVELNYGNDTLAGPTLKFAQPTVDLSLAFDRRPPLVLNAGDSALARLRIVSHGPVLTRGTMDVTLYASRDSVLDPGDVTLATLTDVYLQLRPGRTMRLPVGFNVPTGIVSGNYFLIAKIVPDTHPADPDASDDVAVSSTGTAINSGVNVPPNGRLLFSDTFALRAGVTSPASVFDGSTQPQSGDVAPLTYSTTPGLLGHVDDVVPPGQLVLIALCGGEYSAISPDHNFVEPPGLGNATVISFDVNPVTESSVTGADRAWVCVDLGSGASSRNQFPNSTDGVGILFRGDRAAQAFYNGTELGEPRYAPAADTVFHHIRVEITDPTDGNPFDRDGSPAVVRAFADGDKTPFFTYTVPHGFASDYVSFVAEAEGGPAGAPVDHALRNFTVAIAPATPDTGSTS